MTICKLTARWNPRRLPLPGQWLKSPRGRTAYEIVGVRAKAAGGARGYNLVLTVERHPPSDIPPGATVHNWYWDRRERRR